MARTYIGAPIRRAEDRRFLTGTGQFVDDVKLPNLLQAAIVRSSHAHARLLTIDASAARLMPGVVAVWTYKDIEDRVEPRPIPIRMRSYAGIERFLQYPLAHHKVRYVGEPVAVVIAESRYLAEDAVDGVTVVYEPLSAVVDVWQSLQDEVLLFEEHGTNLAYEFASALGDVDRAFRQADYTRKEVFRCHRHTANPLETRGLVASYAPGRQELTVWGETKVPHFNRGVLAAMLQMPEHRIHFIEPDVGGGFGVRGEFYPENFLIPFAAIQAGRPVKWIEDRREHLISANHSREHVCELEVAARNDGTILGLRARIYGALGGYARTHGAFVPVSTAALLTGPYHIPNYQWEVKCLLTNKVGMGTFSAPGRYESCFFRERLLDIMAADLRLDPAALRLKNLIPPAAMPYELGRTRPEDYALVYDSGDYPAVFKKALEMLDYEGLTSSRGQSQDGRCHGVGVACFVKSTATGTPYEGARVVVSSPDQVAVYLGIATLGQGHETVMAQICADGLGVPLDCVAVYHGSTDFMPFGGGTSASRVTTLAGNAVYGAAQQLRQKILRISAGYLDVDPGALEFSQGQVYRKGCPIAKPVLKLGEVLELAGPASRYNQGEMGLEVTYYFQSSQECYPCGAHAVHLAVDPETGKIDILKYAIAEDVGHVINPLLLTGQGVGAAAQGVGATLLEELVYDDAGQPLASTFMDYLLPTSRDVPAFDLAILDLAPSPLNPLGVKGAGEIGIVATGAALSNAVSHALGVQVRELPLSPNKIKDLIGKNLKP
ncbi:6-hydroxypseudooxynicotine dehydrogenase complex subunit gamma [Candidatus Entotheonellaceae bacterium PAL068K]